MIHINKGLLVIIFFIPFILGFYGFISEGESILDSAYYTFALYAVNPVSDKINIFIELSRWLAPAVMASSLLVFIKSVSKKASDYLICKRKDSFALYGDSKDAELFRSHLHNSVVSEDGKLKKVVHHIIMFERDEDSFSFFKKNRNYFEGKSVFLKTDSIKMFRNNIPGLNILNLKEVVATDYWKKHNLIHLFESEDEEINIAFLCFDELSKELLDYGILNNIYTKKQRITYHIWGDSSLYKNLHSDLNLMNGDKIVYHNEKWEESISLISEADRIIITSPISADALFMLSEKCLKSEIHCYNANNTLTDLFDNPKMVSFGKADEIISKDIILLRDIYNSAKLLNFKYACLYGSAKKNNTTVEDEWKKLDAFTKNSNICAANYHYFRRLSKEKFGHSINDLAQMEHIRWCRFHFLNHWSYGETADNKKDSENKIHPCLVPFESLSNEDKQKDIDAIKVLEETLR